MKTKTRDALRYYSVLILSAIGYFGTILTFASIFPRLMNVWGLFVILGLAVLVPFAAWLDRRMP